MKNIYLILIILFIVSCGESGNVKQVFYNMKEAACSNDAVKYKSFIDMNAFVDSVFSKPIKNKDEREKIIKEIDKTFVKYITNNKIRINPYCDVEFENISIEKDIATVTIQQMTYYKRAMIYKLKENEWKFIKFTKNSEGPKRISINDFLKDFKLNSIAANDKYINKPVAIYGAIGKIAKDENKKSYIIINNGSFGIVKCYIMNRYIADLKNLESGQNLKITGIYKKTTKDKSGIIELEMPILNECVYSI